MEPVEWLRRRCYARFLSGDEGVGTGVLVRQQELTAANLWTEVSGRLKEALNDTTFSTWFGDVSSHELTDEAFVLSVPNDFTRQWIEGHFLDLIGAAVRDATGGERRIRLAIDEDVPDRKSVV